jgi:hypothetical protein
VEESSVPRSAIIRRTLQTSFIVPIYIAPVGDALKQTEPRRMHFCSLGYMEATFSISKNIEFKHLNCFKKYNGVDNIVMYQCVNFWNVMCCILGLAKKTNLDLVVYEQ